MRKTPLIILALLLIMVIPQPSSAVKVQKDDTWQYTDSFDVVHDETALDIVQLDSGEDIVAAALVNTTRPMVHNYQGARWLNGTFINLRVDFDLDMNKGPIYVTQQGGIPIYPDRQFEGNISIYAETDFTQFNVSFGIVEFNMSVQLSEAPWEISDTAWSFGGDPSSALTTTTSVEYYIESTNTYENVTSEHLVAYNYLVKFIISSNSEFNDPVKDFTFTKTMEQFSFRLENGTGDYASFIFTNRDGVITGSTRFGIHDLVEQNDEATTITAPLFLSQLEDEAMLITINEDYSVPTYIRQTEPVNIKRGLALSQLQLVEYFLVIDDGESSDNGFNIPWNLISITVIVFMVIVIYQTVKDGRWAWKKLDDI